MDELIETHKKQKKDLQGQIQKLKKSIPKGDKRRHKEVMERVAEMEADLARQQAAEIAEQKEKDEENSEDNAGGVGEHLASSVGGLQLSEDGDNMRDSTSGCPKGPGRAQRRRDKKAAAAKRRDEEIRAAELLAEEVGPRAIEYRRFTEILTSRGLTLYEVPSDGNCLYCAIQHQLSLRERNPALGSDEDVTIDWLRRQTAQYMLEHANDFLPFMSNPETGEPLTLDDFTNYCEQIVGTSTWGGQPEIRSLSSVLQVPIEVLQTDAPSVLVGDEFDGPPLILTYHRHAFGLGEHYNSAMPTANGDPR